MYLNLCGREEKCVIIFSFNSSEFKDVGHQDEPEEIIPIEPVIQIDREQLLARYHVCSYGYNYLNIH